ncbi:hypothetical protein NE237_020081 [Protea cynaroides]|uniref:Uncharacterized protein n=1 Tax=Protea cynaroides TaxID=273540 RepID=A0A9Q0H5B3_9MAGN|nr:hypothetical protein NE237_020081 [Protea cynaroides]
MVKPRSGSIVKTSSMATVIVEGSSRGTAKTKSVAKSVGINGVSTSTSSANAENTSKRFVGKSAPIVDLSSEDEGVPFDDSLDGDCKIGNEEGIPTSFDIDGDSDGDGEGDGDGDVDEAMEGDKACKQVDHNKRTCQKPAVKENGQSSKQGGSGKRKSSKERQDDNTNSQMQTRSQASTPTTQTSVQAKHRSRMAAKAEKERKRRKLASEAC